MLIKRLYSSLLVVLRGNIILAMLLFVILCTVVRTTRCLRCWTGHKSRKRNCFIQLNAEQVKRCLLSISQKSLQFLFTTFSQHQLARGMVFSLLGSFAAQSYRDSCVHISPSPLLTILACSSPTVENQRQIGLHLNQYITQHNPERHLAILAHQTCFGSDDCAGMINKYKYYICLWVMFKNVFFSLSLSFFFYFYPCSTRKDAFQQSMSNIYYRSHYKLFTNLFQILLICKSL